MMINDQPVPVPIGYDNWGSPIAEQDIAAQVDGPLFDIAPVPGDDRELGGRRVPGPTASDATTRSARRVIGI